MQNQEHKVNERISELEAMLEEKKKKKGELKSSNSNASFTVTPILSSTIATMPSMN